MREILGILDDNWRSRFQASGPLERPGRGEPELGHVPGWLSYKLFREQPERLDVLDPIELT